MTHRIHLLSLIMLLMVSVISFQSKAGRNEGINVQYECLGGNDYLITVHLFRDCAEFTDTPDFLDVYFTSSCATPGFIEMDFQESLEVSQLCPDSLPFSSCSGGNLPGVDLSIFSGAVNLPPCSDWQIIVAEQNRAEVLNLDDPLGDSRIHVEAFLNNIDGGCNTSPQLGLFNLPFVCVGNDFFYNLSFSDPDGDSLAYSLVPALTSTQADLPMPMSYEPGYGPQNPVNTIDFNDQTGQMNLNPDMEGKYTVVVEVKEYRDGVLIGEVRLDFNVIVIPCAVPPPTPVPGTLEHVSGGAYPISDNALSVCQGDDFCFALDFSSTDPSVNLTLDSDFDQLIPGATTSQSGNNPATIQFCGEIPVDFQGGTFVVSAIDDFCPIYGQAFFAVQLSLREPISAGQDTTVCAGQTVELFAENDTGYTWFDEEGLQIVVGEDFSCNPCSNPTAQVDSSSVFVVEGEYSGGTCAFRDTIKVNVPLEVAFNVIPETCYENDGIIEIEILTGSGDYEVVWSDDPTAELLRTDLNEGSYSVTLTDQVFGCSRTLDFFVDHLTFPIANTGEDDISCGLGYQTEAIPSFGASSWLALQPGVEIEQVNSPFAEITVPQAGTYQFVWTEDDGDGCLDRDTLEVVFYDVPIAELSAPDSICGNVVQPSVNTENGLLSWTADPDVVIEEAQAGEWTIVVPGQSDQELVLEVQNGPCLAADTIQISFLAQPSAEIQEIGSVCGPSALLQAVPSVGSGNWLLPSDIQAIGNLSEPGLAVEATVYGNFDVIWTEVNASFCFDSDTATISFIEIPIVPEFQDTTVCGMSFETESGIVSEEVFWSADPDLEIIGQTSDNPEFIGGPGQYMISVNALNAGLCEVSDSFQITFLEQPEVINAVTDTVCGLILELAPETGDFEVNWTSQNLEVDDPCGMEVVVEAPEEGLFELVMTLSNTGQCLDSTVYSLLFYNQPEVSLVPAEDVCGLVVSMQAEITGYGELDWFSSSESVSIEAINDSMANITSDEFGAFWVGLVETNGLCVDSDSSEIEFQPIPEMLVNWDGAFCSGDSSAVSIAFEGESPFGFTWSSNEGIQEVFTQGDTIIYLSQSGSFTISELADQRCASDSVLVITIMENPLPIAETGPDILVCTGDTIEIGQEAEPGVVYFWSDHPGILEPNSANPNFSVVNPGSFPVSIELVMTAEDVNCINSDTLSIEVYSNPELETFLPALLCEGDTAEALAYGAVEYTWSPNEFFSNPDSSQTAFYPSPGEVEVVLTGSNEAGCTSMSFAVIEVLPSPPATFLVSETEGCEPLSVELSALNPVSDAEYSWTINNVTLMDTESTIIRTFEEGVYQVELEVTTSEGCKNLSTSSDTVRVFGIDALFEFSPNEPDIVDPVVHFKDLSEGSVFSSWSIDTLATLSGNTVAYAFPGDIGGSYSVCLHTISSEGCIDSLCLEIDIADDFFIYVPSAFTPDGDGINDLFFPVLSKIDLIDYNFRVYNRRGTIVFETNDPFEKWDGTENGSGYYGRPDLYRWELQAKPEFNVETRLYSGTVMLIR